MEPTSTSDRERTPAAEHGDAPGVAANEHGVQAQPRSLQERLLARWEGMPGRRQAMIAFPLVTVLLMLVHTAFFHRISLGRSLGYAIFEGMLITGMVVGASQAEAARRRAIEQGGQGVDPWQ